MIHIAATNQEGGCARILVRTCNSQMIHRGRLGKDLKLCSASKPRSIWTEHGCLPHYKCIKCLKQMHCPYLAHTSHLRSL